MDIYTFISLVLVAAPLGMVALLLLFAIVAGCIAAVLRVYLWILLAYYYFLRAINWINKRA